MCIRDRLVEASKKLNKVVQMGNQQRSSHHTIEIIEEIHRGIIGTPYKALAFYTNTRGEVPLQKKAPVPAGLDWELFQGPAPVSYTHLDVYKRQLVRYPYGTKQ